MSLKPKPKSPDAIAEARIQAALRQQTRNLDLSRLALTSLPESLGRLTGLQSLDLSRNRLTSLPESLRRLTSFMLSSELTSLPPDWLGNLTGLQSLNLSDNRLTSLPGWLGKLTNLQSLDLSINSFSNPGGLWLGELTSLRSLNLSRNRLEGLPESLGRLTGLQSLNLSDDQLWDLPGWLGNLTGLRSLNLSQNRLTSLPGWLGKLTNLQSLNLFNNWFTSLPDLWLGELRGLKSLDLSANQLTSLPEWFGKLTTLQSLSLSSNSFTSLPDWLGKLTNLQSLNLSSNRLTSLPAWLGNLISLQSLDLDDNQLTSLPDWLGNLTGLQELYLHHNRLTSLPAWLGNLTGLQKLYLHHNRLTSLPDWFGNLTSLQSLHLLNNQLASLPESLGRLTNLQSLDLSGNQLTSLPESLGNLTSLQSLHLSANQLTTLPVGIRKLRELTHFFVHENPGLAIPVEMLDPTPSELAPRKEPGDPAAILDYYFRIHPPEREGKRPARVLRELKVILVGRGEVGKTSLIDVLKGGEFIEGMKKTEGITITLWPLMLADGKEATARVWDFGGQEIMHGTHQFFLTHRSLYLVVVDGRHDRAKQDAEYWLKLVRAFGGQSPVLVVLNKQRRHAYDTDREYLAKKYEVAREHFFRTDCADEASVDQLRKAFEHEAVGMLAPKELFPAEWWTVKERLGAMKEHGENYLSAESYENLCKELNVEEKDADILLRRLTELGTVVSFPDFGLRELTVLNPEWVTDGIYRVLNDDLVREQRHGQLVWDELTRILPAHLWPMKRHRFLVELMRKFELCFPLEGEADTELVPELLPDKTPPLDDWNPAECLVFLYEYPMLPYGVLPRFITRTHSKSQARDRWRSGVVLAREEAEAVVRADYDKNQVIVWVRGRYADARRGLLTVVRDDFAAIHGRIKGLNPKELVAVKGHPEVAVRYDDLLKDEREGLRTTRVTVGEKRIDVDIAELLNGVESPEDRAKRAKEEERLAGVKAITHDNRVMGNLYETHYSGGTFYGPVAVVMNDCINIINNQPAGERKQLLETLQKQIGELISGPAEEKQQLRKEVADRLKKLTEGVTSGTPDREWYSVSAKGLLDAAKYVKEFSGAIAGTLKNIGSSFWPDFTLPDN
jgi:internalin A